MLLGSLSEQAMAARHSTNECLGASDNPSKLANKAHLGKFSPRPKRRPGGSSGLICYDKLVLDGIGTLAIREQDEGRLVLGLSSTTRFVGGVLLAVGLYAGWSSWGGPWAVTALCGAVLVFGATLASLERTLVFDRSAGTVVVRQSLLGVGTRSEVPLFHLRAVVVVAPEQPGTQGAQYVAYLDRRVGTSIYLDEAKRCARLLRIAEAIAEVAELRLEYEAA